MPQIFEILRIAAISAVAAIVLFQVFVAIARRFLYVCQPGRLLVFSGRESKRPDGSVVGYRLVTNGNRTWRVPFLERVEAMDLTSIPLEVSVSNAYSNGGIPLAVQAVANVKITSDPVKILNAVERLLGRSRVEIQQVARETLEGSLRGIIATLTPEELNEDRLTFAKKVQDEADADLGQLGIQLDTLKIQAVSDEVKYLDSIGRAKIAELIKKAEIAESDARNEANKRAAAAKARADVATSEADQAIVAERNRLAAMEATLKAQVRGLQMTAQAASQEARSLAERELQEIRKEVEMHRLQADVVLPAEADREARELLAKGAAAPIAAQGEAMAESVECLARAWADAGDDAREIFLLNQLEGLVGEAAHAIDRVTIRETHLIDQGDGRAVASLVSSFPETIASVLASIRRSTGVDIPSILTRSLETSEASDVAGRLPARPAGEA